MDVAPRDAGRVAVEPDLTWWPQPKGVLEPRAHHVRRPHRQRVLWRRAAALPRVVERFPATFALLISYGTLVLGPSVYDHDGNSGFVWAVVAAGLVPVLTVELFFRVFLPRTGGSMHRVRVHRAGLIAVLGALTLFAGTFLGLGVYGYGVSAGLQSASPLATYLTPFADWRIVGLWLCFYAWRGQPRQRKAIIGYTLVVSAVMAISIVRSASTGSLVELAFVLAVGAVLAGVIRLRWVAVALAVLILLWPAVYVARDAARYAKTGFGVATAPSVSQADSRIHDDFVIVDVLRYRQEGITGASIPFVPTLATVVRAGLLPRFLDPGRPIIQTSNGISIATSGTATSSSTLTGMGELWLLGGYPREALTYGAIAVVVGLLRKQRHPLAFVLIGAVVYEMLWVETTFPDAIAGTLQFAVSALVACLLFWPIGRRAAT